MALYALTIFISSFLLFQVQPLIGKYILPWYGGTPAVWTTCMLFFQVLLPVGYAYAHFSARAGRIRQGYIHLVLLIIALPFLPITPSADIWKPGPNDLPIVKILLLLSVNIGIPYLILSSTAPLLQHWFTRSFPDRSPYRLYALSNAASLLALISYPFIVEPRIALDRQVVFWSWGFTAFAVCCALCALQPQLASRFKGTKETDDVRGGACSAQIEVAEKEPIRPLSMLIWLLLSACGSAMLLATTNQLCQEVAVVPFLWVVPLALYLITFIICFNSEKIYDRLLWGMLLVGALIPACRVLYLGVYVNLSVQILTFSAALFACCMVCHGELVRSRPDPKHLTAYYLIISIGGAIGGIFVALLAPIIFNGFWEYPLVLAFTCLVIIAAFFKDRAFVQSPRWLPYSLIAGEIAIILFAIDYIRAFNPNTIASSRNFYGVLRVKQEKDDNGPKLAMLHGRVTHGIQYTSPERQKTATTYYGNESAPGLAFRYYPSRNAFDLKDSGLNVGIVGLGTGTLAVYGQKGDTFRFYEINPEVVKMAEKYFTYLKGSSADVQIALGDARITLERELKQKAGRQFDLLIIDAFSSDAIPVHLLTKECFSLYLKHLKPDGIILVHITNRYLDLRQVVRNLGESAGLRAEFVVSPADDESGVGKADWMILTSNTQFLDHPNVKEKLTPLPKDPSFELIWTDDFAPLWQILKM